MNTPPLTGEAHREVGPVSPEESGQRLDVWLARRAPDISRARWQEWIKNGRVTLNGLTRKPNHPVSVGDSARVVIPPPEASPLTAEAIALDIIHEDRDILVVNKPAGLVVHPAPGHASGTLVNALLFHCRDLEGIGGEKRPGIVHRLDRETSGVLVVAKRESALMQLARQFKDRTTTKEYLAVVWGVPNPPTGAIKAAIGRDPVHRKKMSVRAAHGRPAVSHYRVYEKLNGAALLEVRIETGRTHQIRVHLAHIKHPVIGDSVYGRKRPPDPGVPAKRHMLHAWKLRIRHPTTGEDMLLEAPVPPDFQDVVAYLKTPA
ncbi:MAG TPA: RluA family pseudouridine synthase [Kiritimatiellia bacterium]|nr:RluA family pseudouridine synthase [Kiritimatiellia bacterium]HMO98952.1 RluA family pseudouridine synthase [Kiritimatiellia bacterium]HMP95716.1 RluA family pseudouridine synthase [Kiritimatiellia bacterium]